MELDIVLSGLGGELDRRTITLTPADDGCFSMREFADVCSSWILKEGDTIRIVAGEA